MEGSGRRLPPTDSTRCFVQDIHEYGQAGRHPKGLRPCHRLPELQPAGAGPPCLICSLFNCLGMGHGLLQSFHSPPKACNVIRIISLGSCLHSKTGMTGIDTNRCRLDLLETFLHGENWSTAAGYFLSITMTYTKYNLLNDQVEIPTWSWI